MKWTFGINWCQTTHSIKLTIYTKQDFRKRQIFPLQVIFYLVWNFVMKIPSHHASFRQNDKFVFVIFIFFSFTACQIELFHVFAPWSWSCTVHIRCTWPATTWWLRKRSQSISSEAEQLTAGRISSRRPPPSVCFVILWRKKRKKGRKKKAFGDLLRRFTQTETGCLHTYVQYVPYPPPCWPPSPSVRGSCARRSSGSCWASCLITCRVSGSFQVLWFAAIARPQFGESLNLTHFTEYNVLHYILCFFFFQFSFWKYIFF